MTKLHNNQSGLVSIIVAIVFITIMSLIATSFALLSRREARQALDRQLSTQAFYAAESGVNDAIKLIKDNPVNITDCADVGTINPGAGPQLNEQLSYSCVLINEQPTSLEFAPITTEDSTIVRVQAAENISKLRISWQDFEGNNTFATDGSFLLPQASYNTQNQASFANHTGILRTSIIPVTGSMNRDSLINNTQTLFLYPRASASTGAAGSYAYNPSQATQGNFVSGQCNKENNTSNNPRFCNVDITGLSAAGTKEFYVRLDGIYRNSAVTIQAYANDSVTNPLALVNGQVVIDATGKATDVLRRIQVRVPVKTEFKVPKGALETADNVCKLIQFSATRTIDGCTDLN